MLLFQKYHFEALYPDPATSTELGVIFSPVTSLTYADRKLAHLSPGAAGVEREVTLCQGSVGISIFISACEARKLGLANIRICPRP